MAQSSETKAGISRRKLLTASGVGAAGLALSQSAQASGSCDDALSWDRETDVVVVGSGTGLTGALVAAKAGLDVLVLEKGISPGGNTGISGGVAWVPNNSVSKKVGIKDSREQALQYLEHLAQGQADLELREAFVDNGSAMLEFIEDNTSITWRVSKLLGSASEYHPEWKGAVNPGRSVEPEAPSSVHFFGGILISSLMQSLMKAGGQLLLEHPAEELIWQVGADGQREVLGVIANHKGKKIRIRARKGVHLASGGFEHNQEMKKHFLRGPSPYSLGVKTNTGDGLRMAMGVGADLRNLNECWGISAYQGEADAFEKDGTAITIIAQIEKRSPGNIVVNRHGERFHNEGADYDSSWRSYLEWENWGDLGYRNMPAFQISDSKVRENASIGGRTKDMPLPDWVVKADTLEELADKLGVDKAGLLTTVKEFNKHARKGKDPIYHRGESDYDTYASGTPAVTLAPVEKAPFYGAQIGPADLGTCGGPRVNGNAQVQDVFGKTIKNLYASGNCAGVGSPGSSYGGGGGTIGPALTFAYIAGNQLARS
jgi:3-oxosteroid 1-dehydrogenase